MLIHALLRLPAVRGQKLHRFLTNWHNSIFDWKLKTIETEIPQKVKNSQPQLKIDWFL